MQLGDVNGDGVINNGEAWLGVNKDVAKSIMTGSIKGDSRLSMLQQAIAAQLNIYNGDINPGRPWSDRVPPVNGDRLAGDLITEAVLWLKTYGNVGQGDDLIDAADYNLSKGAFKSAQTSSQARSFWSVSRDVDGNVGTNVQATGEDLKNVLMAFNANKLVTSSNGQVGWNSNTTSPESVFSIGGIVPNGPDAFWQVARDNIGNFGLVWRG